YSVLLVFCFFFQAEDGIRDFHVTGVQTCALPISVMFHLVIDEAIKRNRKIGIFLLDWECQFEMTIEHIDHLVSKYSDNIELYWVCLEVETMSACSAFEPIWRSWDEEKKNLWTRQKHPKAITDPSFFPFYYKGITF